MGAGPSDQRVPLLSVVVPAHRVDSHLVACVDSILSEADDRVEVVGVNDSSPDRSGEILDAYARRDARVQVVHLDTNVGLGQARNEGLEHATGSYVWFVDGDDQLPVGAVPAVLDRLTGSTPDVLVVDHVEVSDSGRVEHRRPPGVPPAVDGPVRIREQPQLLRLAQSACTKIVRRAFLDEIKLRFAPGWYEDTSFSHPLLVAAERVEVLDLVCYHYRQHDIETITTTVSSRHFEVFDQYERVFTWVEGHCPDPQVLLRELFRVMIDHYLVIIGNDRRLPAGMRRDFFRRMATDYRARYPAGGYDEPAGVSGLKHRLVRHGAYRTYTVLRRAYRASRRLFTRPPAAQARRPRLSPGPPAVPVRPSGHGPAR